MAVHLTHLTRVPSHGSASRRLAVHLKQWLCTSHTSHKFPHMEVHLTHLTRVPSHGGAPRTLAVHLKRWQCNCRFPHTQWDLCSTSCDMSQVNQLRKDLSWQMNYSWIHKVNRTAQRRLAFIFGELFHWFTIYQYIIFTQNLPFIASHESEFFAGSGETSKTHTKTIIDIDDRIICHLW